MISLINRNQAKIYKELGLSFQTQHKSQTPFPHPHPIHLDCKNFHIIFMFPYNQLCYIRVGGVTNYDNLQMLEFETYNIQLCPSLLKQHNFKFF